MAEIHVRPTAEEAAQAKAQFVAALAKECSANQGRFTIALSGGNTPRRLYEVLASPPYSEAMEWDRWQVFWSDDRCVTPDHQDSNYRMAKEELLDHVPIPDTNVHRMRGEDDPHEAARAYEAVIGEVFQSPTPSFDLVLLGIGDDGHTASLFPGTPALGEQNRLVVDNWVPDLQVHRITFTLPLINAAKVVAFLDTDGTKAGVLRQVLEPAPGEAMPPAGLVRPSPGVVHWFLTAAAAGRLKSTQV
ncbi:MAG: 6-phosphogluconolactonase [Chloroflexi bacterium]|nr:6-phosphogluconolactonase [Chloroflexota bacterium]